MQNPWKPFFAFLDLPDRMYQGTLTTEKRSDRQYEVEFRDVSFRYPGTHEYALRHVTMKFRIGERLAIVGRNGSGKTTFIKLLCRLYDPDEGEILLNGIDIRKYNYQDYLRVFSVVFQDFQLLPFPLGENVAASYTVDRERAEHCLRVAGFGDRLDSMPDGLDTFLTRDFSEKGVTVSAVKRRKSRWPVPCTVTLPLSFWTNPPRLSILWRNMKFIPISTIWWETKQLSISATVSPPAASAMQSLSLIMDRLSSRGRMNLFCRTKTASMRHCGKHRHSIIGNTKRYLKIRRKNKSKKTQADPFQGCLRFYYLCVSRNITPPHPRKTSRLLPFPSYSWNRGNSKWPD